MNGCLDGWGGLCHVKQNARNKTLYIRYSGHSYGMLVPAFLTVNGNERRQIVN